MTIVVAGHTGLAGSAIYNLLQHKGESVIGINSEVLDLLDREATFEFIADSKPDLIIDAAAIVGGIGSNSKYPVGFLSKNLQIQCNLMDAAHAADVDRFIFLGSSCIYPRDSKQPMKEEYLMTGPLESTNSAYAVAKIAGLELVKSYRNQFNRRWISLMPTNLYGPNDNFNLETSHVMPALIHKFVAASEIGLETVVNWGTGSPIREFMHSHDFARAVLLASEKYDSDLHLNIGTGQEISVRDLANLIAEIVKFRGKIVWSEKLPDGTPRKTLDINRLMALEFCPSKTLQEGISETIGWFKENRSRVRI